MQFLAVKYLRNYIYFVAPAMERDDLIFGILFFGPPKSSYEKNGIKIETSYTISATEVRKKATKH